MPGMFIDVEVDDSIRRDAGVAANLAQACPVDIYEERDGELQIVEDNLDECVLCELCIDAAPAGSVRVVKLYDGTKLGN